MNRKFFPTIYLDEHAAFMRCSFQSMRVIEIAKTKLKVENERNFINRELYANNGIFVTSDKEFLIEISDSSHTKHSGIIFVPKEMTKDEKLHFCEIACAYVKSGCKHHGQFVWRNSIIYPAYDGVKSLCRGKDQLLISWDELFPV